jgi:hypothetical protein
VQIDFAWFGHLHLPFDGDAILVHDALCSKDSQSTAVSRCFGRGHVDELGPVGTAQVARLTATAFAAAIVNPSVRLVLSTILIVWRGNKNNHKMKVSNVS